MATYNLGKNGTFNINAVSFKASKATVKTKCGDVDCSNTEGSGYEERMDGLFGLEITVEGPYDPTDDPFGTTGLNVGAKVAGVTILNSVSSQTIATMTSGLIIDLEYENPVAGGCTYKATLRSDGSFTTLMK